MFRHGAGAIDAKGSLGDIVARMKDARKHMEVDPWPLSGDEDCGAVFRLLQPARARWPIVFSSPHSGRCYPVDFVARSPLTFSQLRASEDLFVDRLFDDAPATGCWLIAAQYPRVWLDLNRAADELSPEMFADAPAGVFADVSERAASGLGVIPAQVSEGQEIYAVPPSWAQAQARIRDFWKPYHHTLKGLLLTAMARFGTAVLVDCHSMPETAARAMTPLSLRQPDIILGDREGSSCAALLTDTLETLFREAGFNVRRNRVYTGGYITQAYGLEGLGAHAVQIEINRRLYQAPGSYEMTEAFLALRETIGGIVRALPERLRPLWEDMVPAAAE